MQIAEIVAGFRRRDPLQDTVRHFHQRHGQTFGRRHRRRLQPDIAAADNQHPPPLRKLRRHRIHIRQITHGINPVQIAPDRSRQSARLGPCGQHKVVIGQRFPVNRHRL